MSFLRVYGMLSMLIAVAALAINLFSSAGVDHPIDPIAILALVTASLAAMKK